MGGWIKSLGGRRSLHRRSSQSEIFFLSDVFLKGVVDLFGDPVPASRGKKGRPPHVPTAENRRFVQLSLACGHDEETIAAALQVTVRTLNRHYFHELSGKASARLKLEMKNMAAMVAQVEAGSVAAMSLLDKKMERLRLEDLSGKFTDRPKAAPAKPIGIKAAAKEAAGKVTGKFAPPAPPRLN
jgi:hypothetical protein